MKTNNHPKYEIKIVIAQRKCSYEGEFAPECLACMSEYAHADNPEYLHNIVSENRTINEFDAIEIITLHVDSKAIDAALFPSRNPIPAKVIPDE